MGYMKIVKELGPLTRFILLGEHSRCSIRNNDGEEVNPRFFFYHYDFAKLLSSEKDKTVVHNCKCVVR